MARSNLQQMECHLKLKQKRHIRKITKLQLIIEKMPRLKFTNGPPAGPPEGPDGSWLGRERPQGALRNPETLSDMAVDSGVSRGGLGASTGFPESCVLEILVAKSRLFHGL